MKKTIVYLILLLFVGTSLSPTILGLVEETPIVINNKTFALFLNHP